MLSLKEPRNRIIDSKFHAHWKILALLRNYTVFFTFHNWSCQRWCGSNSDHITISNTSLQCCSASTVNFPIIRAILNSAAELIKFKQQKVNAQLLFSYFRSYQSKILDEKLIFLFLNNYTFSSLSLSRTDIITNSCKNNQLNVLSKSSPLFVFLVLFLPRVVSIL